jgi:hypothetical protein
MRSQAVVLLLICTFLHLFTTLRWHRAILETSVRLDNDNHLPPAKTSRTVDPSLNHPHFGALDEFLHSGYVHDPKVLRQRTSSNFTLLPEERPQLCAPVGSGPEGGQDLGRELFGNHIQVLSALNSSINVFCAIYTYPGNKHQANAIRDTWGRRCDGIMFASTETIHDKAIVNLPHAGKHKGMYKGIWQKVRSMLGYIYDNFLNDYDFFLLSGDDTFVIVENLKAFLASPQVMDHAGGHGYPKPMYTGSWVHPFWLLKEGYSKDFYYMGGGAGYVLNRAAVKELVELAWPTCKNTTDDFAEDVYMADCLEKYLNVTGYDSRDDQGGERFIPYDPIKRASIAPFFASSEKADKSRKSRTKLDNLDEVKRVHLAYRQQAIWRQMKHNWTQMFGINYVSPKAVSFHMVQPAIKMKRYEQLLYYKDDRSLCRDQTVSG